LTRPKSFSTPLKPPPPHSAASRASPRCRPADDRRRPAAEQAPAVPRPSCASARARRPVRLPLVLLLLPVRARCALVGLGVRNDLTILGQRNDALVFIHALISAAVAYPCFYSLILLSWICCPMVALTEIYRSPEINLIYHLFLLLLLESRGMKN
jgi:hypothetical protein